MNSSDPACPRCDYARRGRGRPRHLGGGVWHCTVCGNRWRELGGEVVMLASEEVIPASVDIRSDRFADTLALLRTSARHRTARSTNLHNGFRLALNITGAVAAIAAGWLLTAAGSYSLGLIHRKHQVDMAAVTGSIAAPAAASAFDLAAISAGKVNDRDGTVHVEGSITNRSSRRQPLPPIDIVITAANGKRVGGWQYRLALGLLEPGQTIRFSSTKADLPALAHGVEVHFAGLTKTAGL